MRIRTLILLLLFQSYYLQAQLRKPVSETSFTIVDSLINKAIKEKRIPSMVIAIARNGKIIYEKAFGYADAGQKVEATTHTPYQLASATKPFTATAILILHERGLLNIDSPVTKYVPELTLNKGHPDFAIPTVRQVLNHTSGLGTYFDIGYADENYTFDDFEKGWKTYGTIFLEPGTVCEYSNLGYGLLGRVITNVTHQAYTDFMAAE